jgi:(E)-4-hydroxy-3-methylbut-2-enyl-diphosphate synthase
MVYVAGRQDHRVKDVDIVEHLAQLVERRAAELAAASESAAA